MRYETAISENNLKNWGRSECVREFLQNAVFAKSILGDEVSVTHDGDKAVIQNYPSGFSKGKLLIGESEQANVAGAPGQYGEGMKVAMAVALRCGMEVSVETNGFTVLPTLEPSSLDSSVQVLVFNIEDTDLQKGTTFYIDCTLEELTKASEFFAVLNGVGPEEAAKPGIMDIEVPGIYINGVLIPSTKTIKAYNFTNPQLMNRDRTTLDQGTLVSELGRVIGKISDVDELAELMKAVFKDPNLLEAQAAIWYHITDKDAWKTALQKVVGSDKVAIATGDDYDTNARYHKFTVLANLPSRWIDVLNSALDIPYTSSLTALDAPKRIHRKPVGDDSNNLAWCKRMIKLYYEDYGTVKVTDNLQDQYGNSVRGVYERNTDITWLNRDLLSSKEMTFRTLLHETIHRVSGYDDNTTGFTQEWERACWKILTRGKGE